MHYGEHLGQLFQMSYITRDMDAAIAHCEKELGLTGFNQSEPEVDLMSFGTVQRLKIRAATINIGRHQFELIQPISGPTHVYTDEVDLNAHIINYHHTAIAITGGYENWEKMVAEVRASGDDFAFLSPWEPVDDPMLCFCYVDTRKRLGHYTEFMWWHPSMVGVIPMIPNLDA